MTARALSVNVTVVGPTAAGYLRIYPGATQPPGTSTINFKAGDARRQDTSRPASDGREVRACFARSSISS